MTDPTQPLGQPQPTGQTNDFTQHSPIPVSPSEQRITGVLAHVIPGAALVLSAGTLGFFGSLVIYLLYKDRGDFARQHAANSLNAQIATLIGLVVSGILMLVLIGFITYPLVIVWAVVIHVVGAVKANNGELWDPPMVPRFVR